MQSAILESTGPLDVVAIYREPEASAGPDTLRQRAAELMALLEARGSNGDLLNRPENLHVMVAVSQDILTPAQREMAGAAHTAEAATQSVVGEATSIGEGPGVVLVQASAPTLNELTLALRQARAVLDPEGVMKVLEIEGGRLARDSEPFGYADSTPPVPVTPARGSTARATLEQREGERKDQVRGKVGVARGAAVGPLWLLHQRYENNLRKFFALPTPDARDGVMGKRRDGTLVPGGHAHRARNASWADDLHRRGFTYREDGVEGLAFQALAANPEVFRAALADLLANDALFEYCRAVEAGLYVVPPTAAWLFEDVQAPALDGASRALLREARSPVPALVAYEVVPAVLDYLELARANGLFANQDQMILPPELQRLFEGMEAWLAGAKVTVSVDRGEEGYNAEVENDLAGLREDARQGSAAHKANAGHYVTLGV